MIKPLFSSQVTKVFGPKSPSLGFPKFVKTIQPAYVRNDFLVIEWEVSVINGREIPRGGRTLSAVGATAPTRFFMHQRTDLVVVCKLCAQCRAYSSALSIRTLCLASCAPAWPIMVPPLSPLCCFFYKDHHTINLQEHHTYEKEQPTIAKLDLIEPFSPTSRTGRRHPRSPKK